MTVSFETLELTLACLASVFEQTKGATFEVIVVDNASADGSADAIEGQFPRVKLIRGQDNLGFAAGNNLAAEHAIGTYLLLLNPDTVVLDRAIDKLLAFAESRPEAAIVGGRTLFADGRLNPASCWRRPTPWSVFCIAAGLTSLFPRSRLFARESYGPWGRDTVREVDIVSGCFLLIRRQVWDQLGGFDPAFFMYGEDANLCLRARQLGHTCLICPDATIIHYGGASEKVRADKMVRLFRAKAQLFERHWRPGSRWFGVAMLKLWALTRMVAFGLASLVSPRRAEAYETWRELWRRRGEYTLRTGGATPTIATAPRSLPRAGAEPAEEAQMSAKLSRSSA